MVYSEMFDNFVRFAELDDYREALLPNYSKDEVYDVQTFYSRDLPFAESGDYADDRNHELINEFVKLCPSVNFTVSESGLAYLLTAARLFFKSNPQWLEK